MLVSLGRRPRVAAAAAAVVASGSFLLNGRRSSVSLATPPPSVFTVPAPAMHKLAREAVLERLRTAVGDKPGERQLLFFKGGEDPLRHETDAEGIFRQESTFHYLFGVREPGYAAAIDVKDGKTTLFAPRLPEAYEIWMGRLKTLEEIREENGVDEVAYMDELPAVMAKKAPKKIYVNRGVNTDSGNEATPPSFEGMQALCTVDEAVLHPIIFECRVHKNAEELKVMRQVNRVSANAHIKMMRSTRPGLMEYQLESNFLHSCYHDGGCRMAAYVPIAGSGPNAAILHYGHSGAPNRRQLQDGDMVLCDMGAELHCYSADITNTFPANGKFTKDQRLIFETVSEMQQAVFKTMSPGVEWGDMQALSYRVMCEKLQKAGLLHGDVEDMMAANVGAVLMPHGLGHLLGLETHDVGGYPAGSKRDPRPGYSSLRMQRKLEPGMVITVEPGIYFQERTLAKAKADPKLRPFFNWDAIETRFGSFGGVRLEDNVAITATGIDPLTVAPRTVEEVEAVMRGDIEDVEALEFFRAQRPGSRL